MDDIKGIKDHYNPEVYYRNYIKKFEVALKESCPEVQLDEFLFSIESFALSEGHKSYLKDVSNRIFKYLSTGQPLPALMERYLSTQLKCLSDGMEPNKVFYLKKKPGENESRSLRDRMIYDYLKHLTGTGEYVLAHGGSTKKSAFSEATKFFHSSESTIKKAYERHSVKVQKKKSIHSGFEEYKAKGGKLSEPEYIVKTLTN